MNRWRVRCSTRPLCCSGVLVGTNRMLVLVTASQMHVRCGLRIEDDANPINVWRYFLEALYPLAAHRKSKLVHPVALRPGCAKLSTTPWLTGSTPTTKT